MRNPKAKIPVISASTPIGHRIKTIFEPRFNGSGVKLVSVGTVDVQEKIEAFAPFADMNYMLHRLKIGDRSVLSTKPPVYGDFAGLSDNPVDIINIVHSAEDKFRRFSLEEQAKFNNDWRVWLADVFSGKRDDVPVVNNNDVEVNDNEP